MSKIISILILLLISACAIEKKNEVQPQAPPILSKHFEIGKIVLQDPTPEIKYSYYYYIPQSVKEKGSGRLLLWTDGGPKYDNYEDLVKSLFLSRVVPLSKLAEQHGYIFIMPILPRDWTVHLSAQGLNRWTLLPAPFDTSKYEFYKRPDLELLKIVDHLSEELKDRQIITQNKFFMAGFSSGGMSANRFSILYPERVAAVAIGSAGGFLYPLSSWKGKALTYPVGIADVEQIPRPKITLNQFKKIPHFIFVGDQDLETNHSPVPAEPEKESEAMYLREQAMLILKYLGKTNVERAKKFNSYLRSIGMKPKFILYKGLGHKFSRDMQNAIFDFFDDVKSGG